MSKKPFRHISLALTLTALIAVLIPAGANAGTVGSNSDDPTYTLQASYTTGSQITATGTLKKLIRNTSWLPSAKTTAYYVFYPEKTITINGETCDGIDVAQATSHYTTSELGGFNNANRIVSNSTFEPYAGRRITITGTIGPRASNGYAHHRFTSISSIRNNPDWFGWKRVGGKTAPDTMQLIVNEFIDKPTVAVVTTDNSYKDALAASSLAGRYGGLVLMTKKGSLTPQTKTTLKSAKVTTVFIVGSKSNVSDTVAQQIKSQAGVKTVKRVSATTPSQRAVAVAKTTGKRSDTIIIATQNDYRDALSIAPYSYATKSPILYAEKNKKLSTETTKFIKSAKYKKAIVVGGPIALPASVDTQLKKAGVTSITRVAGANAYATSQQIANWSTGKLKNGSYGKYKGKTLAYIKFQPSVKLGPNKLAVSTGQNWLDALAGTALCGKNKSVMLLADAKNGNHYANAVAFCKANKSSISKAYVFGGEKAVQPKAWNALVASTE